MADRYRYISVDSHLEVNSNRWVHRVAEKYRTVAPKVVTMPDGGDGWTVEGLPPRENYPDLYGGKGRDVWRPYGQTYEATAGTGPGEQRVREQEQNGIDGEVLGIVRDTTDRRRAERARQQLA